MTGRPPTSPLFPYPPLSGSAHPPRGVGSMTDFILGLEQDLVTAARRRTGGTVIPLRARPPLRSLLDRKSTRLNSSHVRISYAVFCLKKKTNNRHDALPHPRI